MKRALGAILAVLGTTVPARAYIDSTPTLGKLIATRTATAEALRNIRGM
jgi:hypothetical protein